MQDEEGPSKTDIGDFEAKIRTRSHPISCAAKDKRLTVETLGPA